MGPHRRGQWWAQHYRPVHVRARAIEGREEEEGEGDRTLVEVVNRLGRCVWGWEWSVRGAHGGGGRRWEFGDGEGSVGHTGSWERSRDWRSWGDLERELWGMGSGRSGGGGVSM